SLIMSGPILPSDLWRWLHSLLVVLSRGCLRTRETRDDKRRTGFCVTTIRTEESHQNARCVELQSRYPRLIMRSGIFSFSAIPPTIKWLLIANGIGFLFLLYDRFSVVMHFALWPLGSYPVAGTDQTVGFVAWQLVTYAFLHANIGHLFFNMFALWMFGR